MDELKQLAERAGWPLDKQAAFLEDRNKTQWDAEAIEEAKQMLTETLQMFGAESVITVSTFTPRLYKEPNGEVD
jgi:hypothetical protein